jgi:hypothetical protein
MPHVDAVSLIDIHIKYDTLHELCSRFQYESFDVKCADADIALQPGLLNWHVYALYARHECELTSHSSKYLSTSQEDGLGARQRLLLAIVVKHKWQGQWADSRLFLILCLLLLW